MTLTLADIASGIEYVHPDTLVVGDVIPFFGEPHRIERFITASGPLVDAGLAPADRIALADGGAWQLTLVGPTVPVIRPAVA